MSYKSNSYKKSMQNIDNKLSNEDRFEFNNKLAQIGILEHKANEILSKLEIVSQGDKYIINKMIMCISNMAQSGLNITKESLTILIKK